MGRRGSGSEIRELLHKIREEIPEAVFRTSLIVGFPGESEEDYNMLKEFLKEFQFDYAGIFSYSREEGIVFRPEDYKYSSAPDYAGEKGLLNNVCVFQYFKL